MWKIHEIEYKNHAVVRRRGHVLRTCMGRGTGRH
jgi:hypothetical protein